MLHSSGQRARRVLGFDFLSSSLPFLIHVGTNCFLSESSPRSIIEQNTADYASITFEKNCNCYDCRSYLDGEACKFNKS